MTEWPPEDRAAVYLPPREGPRQPSTQDRLTSLAASRLEQGLPVSEGILVEVLELQNIRDGIETASEYAERQRDQKLASRVRATLIDAGAEEILGDVSRCWIHGRDGVQVQLTRDIDHYRRLLEQQFGRDRVRLVLTPLSRIEIESLQRRLWDDREHLADHHIVLSSSGTRGDGFHVGFYAWDGDGAEQLLRERYGAGVILDYQGASRYTFTSFPFASWLAEDDRLHVFYALGRNGERPGVCHAYEDEHSVVVALSIRDARGPKRLRGGFTPSRATVQLERPLADRPVIDDHANRLRPHWSQVPELPDHRARC